MQKVSSVSCSVLTSRGELQMEQLWLHELFASAFLKSGSEESLSGANQVHRGGQVSLRCPSFQIQSEQKCSFLQSKKKKKSNFHPTAHVLVHVYTQTHTHTHTHLHTQDKFFLKITFIFAGQWQHLGWINSRTVCIHVFNLPVTMSRH